MDKLKILTRARALIADPARWTQGDYARDANGKSVLPNSRYAVCWCSVGALRKVTRCAILPDCAYLALSDGIGSHKSVHAFNDASTHEEVLLLFDRAIKKAKK